MGHTRSGRWYGEDAVRIEGMLQDTYAWARGISTRNLDPEKRILLVGMEIAAVCGTLREQIGFDCDADTWVIYASLVRNTDGVIAWRHAQ